MLASYNDCRKSHDGVVLAWGKGRFCLLPKEDAHRCRTISSVIYPTLDFVEKGSIKTTVPDLLKTTYKDFIRSNNEICHNED
jgi:hypothetical protein